jgi:D-hexose-6-phosphate mutarotase
MGLGLPANAPSYLESMYILESTTVSYGFKLNLHSLMNQSILLKILLWVLTQISLEADTLKTELVVKNVDEKPFSFTTALHTYFAVSTYKFLSC